MGVSSRGRSLSGKLTYLGGGEYDPPGSSSIPVPIPEGANTFMISAHGGHVFFAINEATADDSSPGHVDATDHVWVGPLWNLHALSIYATAPASAHIMFFIG